MKYLKTIAIAALTAAALMVFAIPASATTLTSPAGTAYTSTIKLQSEGQFVLHGALNFKCNGPWNIEAKVESHGPSATAAGKINWMEWGACSHPYVINLGSLEIHTDTASADGNGTLTWTGVELTVQGVILGFPVHCLYTLSNVNLGTITGSKNTGGTARVDGGASKVAVHGSPYCQSEVSGAKNEWTSPNFKITTPDYLDVD